MAVYGGIQAHEVERWLNALTNAAYDRRCPLTKVHGGNARARTARQDLLHLATAFRGGERSRRVILLHGLCGIHRVESTDARNRQEANTDTQSHEFGAALWENDRIGE